MNKAEFVIGTASPLGPPWRLAKVKAGRMETGRNGQYVDVRALRRGIALLRVLNQKGRARPTVLARSAGVERTTAYRLLATLEDLGLVSRSPSTNEFMLTPAVRDLSNGFYEQDRLTRIAVRQLGILFHKVLWPSDFGVFDNGAVVVRETTHGFSPYSVYRDVVGRPHLLLISAMGRALVAGASEQEREVFMEIARAKGEPPLGPSLAQFDHAIDEILEDFSRLGYARKVDGFETKVGAIALPIRVHGTVLGAINLFFFNSALTHTEAAARYLCHLRDCVTAIECEMME